MLIAVEWQRAGGRRQRLPVSTQFRRVLAPLALAIPESGRAAVARAIGEIRRWTRSSSPVSPHQSLVRAAAHPPPVHMIPPSTP